MNVWRFCLVAGFAACGAGPLLLHAQPSIELGQAIDRLFSARNYSWEQHRSVELGSQNGRGGPRRLPVAAGQTEIGGYTLSTVLRRQMVYSETETVYLMSTGWRHSRDLTQEELAEVRFLVGTTPHPASRRLSGHNRPLPHELIRVLFQRGNNIRREQTAIIGDIAWTVADSAIFHAFVEEGTWLSLTGKPPLFSPDLSGNLPTVGFIVWLEGGEISEFSIEFRSAASRSANTRSNGSPMTIELYTTKLSLIGKTKLEIDPEALALFQPSRRDRISP